VGTSKHHGGDAGRTISL